MNNDEKLVFDERLAAAFSATLEQVATEMLRAGLPVQIVSAALMGKGMTLALTQPDAKGNRATPAQLRELFDHGIDEWEKLEAARKAGVQ